MVTDAPNHEGPLIESTYMGFVTPPHTYDQTLSALRAESIRVLGLWAGAAGPGYPPESGRDDMEVFARDTGAVTESGEPIVQPIGFEAAGRWCAT